MKALTSLFLLLLIGGLAHASVVLTNFPVENPIGYPLDSGGGNERVATGFITSSNSYSLDSVLLNLFFADISKVTPRLSLHANSVDDTPASELFVFSNPSFVNGTQNYEFFPAGAFTFQPTTTYWLVLKNVNPIQYDFNWNASFLNKVPTGTFSHLQSERLDAGSSTWITLAYDPTYEVRASQVPEPSAASLLMLGLFLTLSRRATRAMQRIARRAAFESR